MIQVRRATLADAADIARVHVDSWLESYRGIIADDFLNHLSIENRLSQWTRSLADPQDIYHHVLVAEWDGKVVGFAGYGPERDSDPIYKGELFAIYILQSAHGKGIGRRLVCGVAQDLVKLGLSSMLVWVLADNPSRGFYERMNGVLLHEKIIEIGGVGMKEVSYGWTDVSSLLGNEG